MQTHFKNWLMGATIILFASCNKPNTQGKYIPREAAFVVQINGKNLSTKLPWNDVEPESNKFADEPAKVPEHVENYLAIYKAVTGEELNKESLIIQSERVYQFQRIFNIRRGYGLRLHDAQPYRAAGPVTEEEYESRQDRYDKQMIEKIGINPEGKSTKEKVAITRKFREEQYEKLLDAVYTRRGWTLNGVPTVERLQSIGMDLTEVLDVVKTHL